MYNNTAYGATAQAQLDHLLATFPFEKTKQTKEGYLVPCPCHDDEHPSLALALKTDKLLATCRAGCDNKTVWKTLVERLPKNGSTPDITYDYRDEDGRLLHQVVRNKKPGGSKMFYQRKPDGHGGWVKNTDGVRRVLYRLSEVIRARDAGETIFVVEGEKDADNLAAHGLTATTNAIGAGKWKPEYNPYLKGADVVILPDNDEPGREHARVVARELGPFAKRIKVVDIPNLPPKGDVSDWLQNGGTLEQLKALVEATAEYHVDDDTEVSSVMSGHHQDKFASEEWSEPKPIRSNILPVKPFIEEMLPKVLWDFVCDVAHRMQCPPDFVAIPLMVVLGSIIGTGCAIRPKKNDDWTVLPNLWGGIVGRPGALKTPALAESIGLISRMESEAFEKHAKSLEEHEIDKELHEARKSGLRDKLKQAAKSGTDNLDIEASKRELMQIEPPAKPTCRRYRTNDATVEKLIELLQQNARGILVWRDELAGWFTGLDREGREQDRAFYLEGHNGTGSFTQDRIGRGTTHTPNMCVSILGGTQPSKLAPYLSQAVKGVANDGLVQRLQMFVYPDEPSDWNLVDVKPDSEARRKVADIVDFLAETNFAKIRATQSDDDAYPYLRFSDGAQEVFYKWLTKLEREKLRADEHPILIEHLSKYRSLMPKLALIFHLVETSQGITLQPVSEEAAKLATTWCDYLESHARRIYALVSGLKDRAAANLAKKIKEGKLSDGFTARDVYRNEWQYLDDKEIVEEAIEILIDANWLRVAPRDVNTERNMGRPTNTYLINPNANCISYTNSK